jgi:hypothetical protein
MTPYRRNRVTITVMPLRRESVNAVDRSQGKVGHAPCNCVMNIHEARIVYRQG